MFNRPTIKLNARARMRGYLGNPILVSLIAVLLGAAATQFNLRFNFSSDDSRQFFTGLPETVKHFINTCFPLLATAALTVLALVLTIRFVYIVFVSNILRVGKAGWFMRYSRGEYPGVGELFASFRIYTPSLSAMLLRDVYCFLWALLFIIPGVVKTYAYRMVPYIIYENPSLPAPEALRISDRMMQGHKGELFIFDLSFFWWDLLSAITLGIVGIVYVIPYRSTAEAGVYDALKYNAIASGLIPSEKFGMQPAPEV